MRRVTLRVCTPVRVRTVKPSTSVVLRLPSTKVIRTAVQRPNLPIRHFSSIERKSLTHSSIPMTLRKLPKRNTATEALIVTGLVVDGLAGFLLSMSDDDGGPS